MAKVYHRGQPQDLVLRRRDIRERELPPTTVRILHQLLTHHRQPTRQENKR